MTESFVRWEEPPRDYTNDDEETKKHTVYCYCKCPLPLNYAICIDKRVTTKDDICGFYTFYCPNCKTAGLVFDGASEIVKPTIIHTKKMVAVNCKCIDLEGKCYLDPNFYLYMQVRTKVRRID